MEAMTLPEREAILGPIKQRVEKATEGPWRLDENFQSYIWGPNMQMIADDGGDEAGTLTRMRGVGANLPLEANGEFIAAARTDIPALIALVEQQGMELDRLRDSPPCQKCGGTGVSAPQKAEG